MIDTTKIYIDGAWIEPIAPRRHDVIDPSTGRAFTQVVFGGKPDVDNAVAAARRAFPSFCETSRDERLSLLERIAKIFSRRTEDLAHAVSHEMGAPIILSHVAHVTSGLASLRRAAAVLRFYQFDQVLGAMRTMREPVGVCGIITPSNWPLHHICAKVGSALASGCTIVLKPSEIAPLSAIIFAEILDEAGVPPGVFNLVNGDGPGVGEAIVRHRDIDMVSFTGSRRAGHAMSQMNTRPGMNLVQDLGGKSVDIILDDADLPGAVRLATLACFRNNGQSSNAPMRLLVPDHRQAEAVAVASSVAGNMVVGNPRVMQTTLGPVTTAQQFACAQGMIKTAIDEGAHLVAGGLGQPDGCDTGYYVRPTVFADVTIDMTIAHEEVFGPVLSIMPYDCEDEAVALANDMSYGLPTYVTSGSSERARRIARRIRSGIVHAQETKAGNAADFGGYKQTDNSWGWGVDDFEAFLEVKSTYDYQVA